MHAKQKFRAPVELNNINVIPNAMNLILLISFCIEDIRINVNYHEILLMSEQTHAVSMMLG